LERHVVILGNGIAGTTAARHVRKAGQDRITLISDESDEFFSRTALMYVYMGHMTLEQIRPYDAAFWSRNRIGLLRALVVRVDPARKRLHLADGAELPYDVLVLATGSRSNRPGWPGEELHGVQGLYGLEDLERMERDTAGVERAVVVGGGLIGVEMAEMLRSRGIAVTFLVREAEWMDFAFPPEEARMIGRHIREHAVDLRLGAELERIVGDDAGQVRAVVTRDGAELPCGFVGLTVGVGPNVAVLRGSGIECDRGVLVDELLRTSVEDVYAVGDCAQLRRPAPGRRAVEPVWYAGRAMGRTVARTICGQPTPYDPGIWFNSAKFFDLEWQVYGDVPPRPGPGVEELYWEHPAGRRAIRIRHLAGDGAVTGFNLMGIRYRHERCERWIAERRGIRDVLQQLGAANFDAELEPQYEAEVVAAYNRLHPDRPLTLRRRRGLGKLFARSAS